MLIAAIILGIFSIVCGLIARSDYKSRMSDLNDKWVAWCACSTIFGFLWLVTFCLSLVIHIGGQELSGYIYSSSDRAGYTRAHIRYSQAAGADVQPAFCVKSDSVAGREIQKYVGSDSKVEIKIPGYFYLTNNPFACGTTNTIITEVK